MLWTVTIPCPLNFNPPWIPDGALAAWLQCFSLRGERFDHQLSLQASSSKRLLDHISWEGLRELALKASLSFVYFIEVGEVLLMSSTDGFENVHRQGWLILANRVSIVWELGPLFGLSFHARNAARTPLVSWTGRASSLVAGSTIRPAGSWYITPITRKYPM